MYPYPETNSQFAPENRGFTPGSKRRFRTWKPSIFLGALAVSFREGIFFQIWLFWVSMLVFGGVEYRSIWAGTVGPKMVGWFRFEAAKPPKKSLDPSGFFGNSS